MGSFRKVSFDPLHEAMADKARPAEFDLDKKWDKVIDLSLRRIVYGSLAAGLISLVLFSKPSKPFSNAVRCTHENCACIAATLGLAK